MKTKFCYRCQIEKDENEFYEGMAYCKSCRSNQVNNQHKQKIENLQNEIIRLRKELEECKKNQ